MEIHATYSGYADDVTAIHLAADCDAERQFLPEPSSLTGRLLLADRDYPSVRYLTAVRAHGGAFIIRLSTSHDPYVTAAWHDRHRVHVARAMRLSRFLAAHCDVALDLDIEYRQAGRSACFRLVVVPGRAPESLVYASIADDLLGGAGRAAVPLPVAD